MELKILEHCCYKKYLNNWWSERTSEDCWTLIQYGDHTLVELLDWCINMCYGNDGAQVTVAMPVVTDATIDYLKKNKVVTKYDVITREMFPDMHTQIVTITNGERHFVLQGNLLQSVCPGKYITTLGLTKRYYNSIQPLLNSWLRLYAKRQG